MTSKRKALHIKNTRDKGKKGAQKQEKEGEVPSKVRRNRQQTWLVIVLIGSPVLLHPSHEHIHKP